MYQKYKQISKEYHKDVKYFDPEYENVFTKKKFYSFVKSKLKLTHSLPPLSNGSNVPLTSDFDKSSFLINHFKVFLGRTMKTTILNLLKKTTALR